MRSINIFHPLAGREGIAPRPVRGFAATYRWRPGRAIMNPLERRESIRKSGGMMHTYVFEPGVWISKGTFWRADGEQIEAQGRTEIAHHADCWLLSGSMKVLGSPPVEFVSA